MRELEETIMDMNQLVSKVAKDLIEGGYLEETVKKHLQKSIDEAIKDAFGYFSPFYKELRDKLQESLQVNFDKLDLPSYNAIVLDMVSKMIANTLQTEGRKKIEEDLNKILGQPISKIKLSELVCEMMDDEEDYGDEYEGEDASLHISKGIALTYIYMDPEPDKRKYDCKYQITIDSDNNKVLSVTIDGKGLDTSFITKGAYGFEKTLFKLFVNGAVIELDEGQVDTYYGYRD
jgi:hypothetical protein